MKLLALVVGAGGQLGGAMEAQLSVRHTVVARTRQELDVASAGEVRAAVDAINPDVIVNCSAYTNVDGAQGDPLAALSVNAWAVRSLARAAAAIDATLVHFSTDFVFDGTTDRPYHEADPPNPRSTYAMTKLLGEWFAAEAPRHYVLRVESLFGGQLARSSVDRILDGIAAGTEVRAFSDRTVSPSYVDDVVSATSHLLTHEAPYGIYHCVNSGFTTWMGLATEAARLLGRPASRITPIAMADAALLAPRPQFAALDNTRLAEAGFPMPPWEDALGRWVDERART
jgi:dTDP-4-dehydrorhamnose reductase